MCLKPVHTTMLWVRVGASDHPESLTPAYATDDDAAFVIVHRECVLPVMHRDYSI